MAATMPRSTAVLALTLAVLCSAGLLGADARSLLQGGFPYRKCLTAPEGSPYLLSAQDPTVVDSQLYVNLTLISNPSTNMAADCYSPLVNNVFKMLILSSQTCKGAVTVYVNDERKRGSVYWDNKNNSVSLLRITKLGLGAGTLGGRITLVAKAPCNTLAALSGGADTLTYYLTQGPSTKCCPVNNVFWVNRNGQGETSSEGEISGEQSRNGQGEESSAAETSSA